MGRHDSKPLEKQEVMATGNADRCEANEFLHDDWLLLNLHLSN